MEVVYFNLDILTELRHFNRLYYGQVIESFKAVTPFYYPESYVIR